MSRSRHYPTSNMSPGVAGEFDRQARSSAISTAIPQFRKLNREIRSYCNVLGRHARDCEKAPTPFQHLGFARLPTVSFATSEDHVYFGALLIMNTWIFRLILKPFHPGVDEVRTEDVLLSHRDQTASGAELYITRMRVLLTMRGCGVNRPSISQRRSSGQSVQYPR